MEFSLDEVPFLLEGGGGRGMLETFCEKSRGPSHFPEWIKARLFTNTYTKTSDPPPSSSMEDKSNRKCYSHNRVCPQSS